MTINNQTINLDARQILLKRGNSLVSSSYIGPIGEITLDTTLSTIRVHNGIAAGGSVVPTESMIRGWIAESPSGSGAGNSLVNGPHSLTLSSNGVLTFQGNLTLTENGTTVFGKNSSETITEENIGGTISQTTTNRAQIEITDTSVKLVRSLTQEVNDGVVTTIDSVGSTIDVDGTGIYIKRYVEPDGPNNGSYFQFSTSNSGAIMEGVDVNLAGDTVGRITATQGVVAIEAANGGINKSWTFDYEGNLTLPVGGDIVDPDGNSLIRVLRSPDGNLATTLDNFGTVSIPTLFPVSFTAVCDTAHYSGGGNLTLDYEVSEAWHFDVVFAAGVGGTIETLINNSFPWIGNPGYSEADEFSFTEADHGIPGYTLTLTLISIQNPGNSMWTTNLAASQPPAKPSTISSLGAIKLTSSGDDWVFSNGVLTTPGAIYNNGDYRFIRDNVEKGTVNYHDGDLGVVIASDMGINGITKAWLFGDNGNLRLPPGGDIVDSTGTSVLGSGGNANTGNVTFSTNKIFGTNNSLILKSEPDAGYNNDYGLELFNSVDNDTHLRPVNANKGIALGFAYGSNLSHIRVEGRDGQGGVGGTGNRVGIVAAQDRINEYYYDGSNFLNEVDIGGGTIIHGMSQRNETQIEVDLFVPIPSDLHTRLIGLDLADTIEITYYNGSGTSLYVGNLSQWFTNLGQTDPANGWTRFAGRIDGTMPVDYVSISKINIPDNVSRSAEWIFNSDGTITLPTMGSIHGATSSVILKATSPLNPLQSKEWAFDGLGKITFPDETIQTTAYPGITTIARTPGPTNEMQFAVSAVDGSGVVTAITVTNSPNANWITGTSGAYGDVYFNVNIDGIGNATVVVTASGGGHGTSETFSLTGTAFGATDESIIAIDVTKTINKLASGTGYTLANGTEGQIMYLVMQDGTDPTSVAITVLNARFNGGTNAGWLLLPFVQNTNPNNVNRDICTLIFTDGHWQQMGGLWD